MRPTQTIQAASANDLDPEIPAAARRSDRSRASGRRHQAGMLLSVGLPRRL
jgi:hypothetical protein